MSSGRKLLLMGVEACLQQISTDDDYNTDAGTWVTREPGQVSDEAAGVLAVVWERQSKPSDQAVRRTHRLTTVAVIAKLPHEQDQAQDTLDLLLEDIERAMTNQQKRFPIGISAPQWVETLPIPAEKGMGWVGALIRYESHVPIRIT